MGKGPAGGEGGLRQTSGIAATDFPLAALQAMDWPLAYTLIPKSRSVRISQHERKTLHAVAAKVSKHARPWGIRFSLRRQRHSQRTRLNRRPHFPDAIHGVPNIQAFFARP